MNPIKAIVVVLFITLSATVAHAQERYEQMIVVYNAVTSQISISTDSGEYTEESLHKSDSKKYLDISPALVRIKQLSNQGWELYQTSFPKLEYPTFLLRRPLK
jgi:hypothetical protein